MLPASGASIQTVNRDTRLCLDTCTLERQMAARKVLLCLFKKYITASDVCLTIYYHVSQRPGRTIPSVPFFPTAASHPAAWLAVISLLRSTLPGSLLPVLR